MQKNDNQTLKNSKPQQTRTQDDAKTRAIVEQTLAQIEANGDSAVRELSQKFDNYTPKSHLLSTSEITALINKVSTRDMDDIRFAQTQVRNFAKAQRSFHHGYRN